MVLPTNFSSFFHLRSVLLQTHNAVVQSFFLDENNELPELGVSTPRASLFTASSILPDDTIEIIIGKLFFFYIVMGKARALQAPLYGLPSENFHDSVEFVPQVKLIFFEKQAQAILKNRVPIRAEISFRLMGLTPTSITEQYVKNLAAKIKTVMATPVFSFQKGQIKVSYRDLANGYRFILATDTVNTAVSVIQKVLTIQNHTYNSDYLTFSESLKDFPEDAGTQEILGQTVRKPRLRPSGTVRFRRAELNLHGFFKNVLLVCNGDFLDDEAVEIFWDV